MATRPGLRSEPAQDEGQALLGADTQKEGAAPDPHRVVIPEVMPPEDDSAASFAARLINRTVKNLEAGHAAAWQDLLPQYTRQVEDRLSRTALTPAQRAQAVTDMVTAAEALIEEAFGKAKSDLARIMRIDLAVHLVPRLKESK